MRVLIQFYNDQNWIHFRFSELDALLELNNLIPKEIYIRPETPADTNCVDDTIEKCGYYSPFIIATFPNEGVIHSICSRSVLIKQVLHLWDYCDNLVSLRDIIKSQDDNATLSNSGVSMGYHYSRGHDLTNLDKTWSITMDGFGRSLSYPNKEFIRLGLNFKCIFTGKVRLQNPDCLLVLLFDFSSKSNSSGNHVTKAAASVQAQSEEEVIESVPCYFGQLIARGGMKNEVVKYDLKTRLFIGPTSLDHQLSLIMCNIGKITNNSIVLDPFVGTASLLIAASHFRAKCFGSDIDIRVLRGDMYAGKADKSVDTTKRDIIENFKQYQLEVPELMRLDNHMFHRHFHVSDGSEVLLLNEFYDVIITDPPYGIRAGARKSGRKDQSFIAVPEEHRYDHCPHTQQYDVEEVMLDLLHTAASALRVGGYLLYILPTPYHFHTSIDLPVHPCLSIIQTCVQNLSCRHGRHLVVMQKTRAYTTVDRQEYDVYIQQLLRSKVEAPEGPGFGTLMLRLEKALSNEAFEDESVVKKQSASYLRRKQSKQDRAKKCGDKTGSAGSTPPPVTCTPPIGAQEIQLLESLQLK